MKNLTDKMTPRCLGRYLIDLPASFVLNPIHPTKIEGVDIDVQPMKLAAFELAFETRQRELEAIMLPGVADKRPHLRKAIPIPGPSTGAVFDRSKSHVSSSRTGRTLELLAWRDGFQIAASINATDTTFPEDADDSIAKQLRTDVPEKLAHLMNFFERTRGLADGEVPAEQGVCIANGFVRGPASEKEDVEISYQLKDAEDVYFTFHSMGDLKQENELLDRGAAIEANLKTVEGRTLRKGSRKLKGLDAQEWLLTRKGEAVMLHDFTLEANSKTASATTPVLILDFLNGVGVPHLPLTTEESATLKPLTKATLTEAESVALWDAVTPSLRPRPGAF